MHFTHLVSSLLVAGAAYGGVIDESRLHVFEELNTVPPGWEAAGSPKPETKMDFRIALNSANRGLLEETLYDISTPGNTKYGQHLKRDELEALVEPAAEASEAVIEWLKRSGVEENKIEHKGEWVNFQATAKQADAMMATNFLVYRSTDGDDAPKIRTTKVSLPRSVMDHVKMIHPTTRFTQTKAQMSQIFAMSKIETDLSAPDSSCNNTITPTCLRELYNIKGVTVDPAKAGILGVAGFLKQYARFADLSKFLADSAQWASTANFTYSLVNGGVLDQNYAGSASEANLDIQYTVSLSHPMRNHFYSTGGLGQLIPDLDQPSQSANQNEPYLEFFQHMTAIKDPKELPHTISFSYGEDEQSVPPSYAQTVCDMIAQLGTRGVSVIFSSGDTGVGAGCQTNDGKNTTRFLPIFPASCPYVTSIGGTVGIKPERAVGFSSGGFSDRWPRPAYQQAAVKGYLDKLGSKWDGLYNPQGRGFPDIAAQGMNFRVMDKGRAKKISGTSASAPAIAGMIALLNAKRLQEGSPALGFLNPWLYSNGPKMLNDITVGGSMGCTGIDQYSGLKTPVVKGASWAALPGWDAVTGLGTPKFDAMLKLLPPASKKRTS